MQDGDLYMSVLLWPILEHNKSFNKLVETEQKRQSNIIHILETIFSTTDEIHDTRCVRKVQVHTIDKNVDLLNSICMKCFWNY